MTQGHERTGATSSEGDIESDEPTQVADPDLSSDQQDEEVDDVTGGSAVDDVATAVAEERNDGRADSPDEAAQGVQARLTDMGADASEPEVDDLGRQITHGDETA